MSRRDYSRQNQYGMRRVKPKVRFRFRYIILIFIVCILVGLAYYMIKANF